MSENSYKLVVARMPDEDLLTALKANEAMYLDEMILAVLDECEKRKLFFPGADALRSARKSIKDSRQQRRERSVVHSCTWRQS